VVRKTLDVEIAQGVGLRRRRSRMLHHPSMIWGRMGRNLRRLARAIVGDRGVDLRSGRATRRRSTDGSLATGPRRCRALRGLGRKTTRGRPLRILLLERRLLRRRRRRRRGTLQSRRSRRHVRRLLFLLRRVRRRGQATLADCLARKDSANDSIGSRVANLGRLLRRADMLRRWVQVTGRASTGLQLAAQQVDLVIIPDHYVSAWLTRGN
jgi:hypothetical protein